MGRRVNDHARRYGFLLGVLAGLGIGAIGALALLLGTPQDSGPELARNWSPWEPGTTRMVDGAEQIAGHVGLRYKLDSGDQLVSIRSSPLEGEELGVAVRPSGGRLQLLEGEGLLYVLDGLGPNGTTKKRGRLLLREALELALYSFRYLDDVTMVAVRLPRTPEPAAGQTRVVFYRPGDLLAQLQVPLAETLSPKTPTPGTMTPSEAERVDDLTLRNLFLASVRELEADQNYLVLVEPDTIE